jgi:hypothetical protein
MLWEIGAEKVEAVAINSKGRSRLAGDKRA